MTVREKSAWASLIAVLVVFVPYFRTIFGWFAAGALDPGRTLGAFIGATVYLTLLSIGLELVVAILSRRQVVDERDRAIAGRAFRWAYFVLVAGGMSAVVAIVFLGVLPVPAVRNEWLAPQFLAQVLLLCFVLAEAVKAITQIVCYRRGF